MGINGAILRFIACHRLRRTQVRLHPMPALAPRLASVSAPRATSATARSPTDRSASCRRFPLRGPSCHIVVPSAVNDISYESIHSCKGLEGVEVDEGNQTFASIDGNLYSKDGKKFLRLCVSTENTSITIPEGVVEIADYAAYACHQLIDIKLPKSLTSIGEYSFLNCDNLTNITIPENAAFIGSYAFLRCDKMTSVVFEQATGWSVVSQGGKLTPPTNLNISKLDSPTTSAEYLLDTYNSWEWHREN